MKCFIWLMAFVACAIGQENPKRYVPVATANNKNRRCTGYGYIVRVINGTNMIDRKSFTWSGSTLSCGAGTIFSILPGHCSCDVHFTDIAVNRDRCITVNGNIQTDRQFSLAQRNSITRTAYISGFDDAFWTGDGCYGSSNTIFRAIDLFSEDNLANRNLNVDVTFKLPSGINVFGREYLISTNRCNFGQSNTPGSFEIRYIVGSPAVRPTIRASFQLATRWGKSGAGEVEAFITCTIPPTVNSPDINGAPFIWDSTALNTVKVRLDLDNIAALTISLENQQMGARNFGAGGFCAGFQPSLPNGLRRGGASIAYRSCPVAFGIAPDNSNMCIYNINIERDCLTPALI